MNYINLHLKELKFSIWYCVLSITSLIVILYEYIDIFLSYYISLTGDTLNLIFIDIMEVFYINIKLSILFGIIFSIPSVLILTWLFIKPALYKYEDNLIFRFIIIYNGVVLPFVFSIVPRIIISMVDYLNKLSNNNFDYYSIDLLQRFNNLYILIHNFNIIGILLTIIPISVIMIILPCKIKNTTKLEGIEKQRKYIYFIIMVLIAILTPPDILSLIAIFTPIMIIYETIIIIICVLKSINTNYWASNSVGRVFPS